MFQGQVVSKMTSKAVWQELERIQRDGIGVLKKQIDELTKELIFIQSVHTKLFTALSNPGMSLSELNEKDGE
jgi:hypothetical protein